MKDKKQITIISLLGALAVGVLASAVVLGNAYNNSQAQENETEYAAVMESYEPETIAAETEPETETEETSEAETELEAAADETETEAEPETKAETEDTAEADETTPETDENKTPTEKLMSLFETGAPLRYGVPSTVAIRPSTETLAPIRFNSPTYLKRLSQTFSATRLVPFAVDKSVSICGCRSVGNPGCGCVFTLAAR